MKVLCICPIGIGNYLLTYPACYAIKQAQPAFSLHLLGLRHGISDFARNDPLWNDIHIFDPTHLKNRPLKKVPIIHSLRTQHFDASLCFFPSNTWLYNALPFLAGIKKRYAFKYYYNPATNLAFLCSHTITVDTEIHDVMQNMRLAAFFIKNAEIEKQEPLFPALYGSEESEFVSSLLQKFPQKKFIVMHAGSSAEHSMIYKRWAPERFAELADRICEKLNAAALILGGNEEIAVKQRVAEKMNAPRHIIDALPLRETAALCANSAICLCNDSGIMHIASCAGTPVIALFGPTDEKRNGPTGKNALVVRKPMEGFPLWTARNAGNRRLPRAINAAASLNALSVDDAWAQVKPWLDELIAE